MNIIPTVIDKTNGVEKYYDIYSMLLKEGIIMLTGEITDELSSSIIAQLLYLQSKNSKCDIQIYINSPGGSVTAGLAIFDCINHIKNNVCTICVGICASMATIILAAGTKGKRYSLPNGEIMIHQPLGGVNGSESDVMIVANRLTKTKKKINMILSDLTSQPIEKVKKDTDRDYYLDANEALQYGIIDKILDH